MKKIFLSLMLASACFTANAQTTFGIKAGANASSFSSKNVKSTWGFHAGLTMSNKLATNWEVNSALLYTTKGTAFTGKSSLSLNYVELSILPSFVLPTLPGQALVVKAGPYAGYGLNSNFTLGSDKINFNYNDNLFKHSSNRRIDFGFGLGASYRISHIELGIETRFGMVDLYKHAEDVSKNQNVMFSLGYNF